MLRAACVAVLATVAVATIACSGTASGAHGDGGTCTARSGNYVAHFVERPNGTCGSIPDAVVADAAPAGCQGTRTPSADNCSLDIDLTCTTSAATTHETGTSHWAPDGLTGNATMTITTQAGGHTCTSTYDVTFTRA